MINREPIYLALYNLLLGLVESESIKTASRRLKHWSDTPPPEQPAIFQIQKGEDPGQVRMLPTKWKLDVDLYVYVNSGDDPSAAAAELLNPILDDLESLFPTSDEDGPIQTLGGLVSHCWISGRIETAEGVLGQQEVAIVPIEILVT